MYRTAYQRYLLTIFFSGGSNPLSIWETTTKDGYIKRFLDPEIKTMVLEIRGSNISTTYMSCPKGKQVLGITMPFLVMTVKNLNKYFSFEVTVLDSTGTRRRFRVSNFQSTTQILPLCTVMPIGLAAGWNQIQFNLAEFTRRAYKNQFVEVQRLKINANIRLRRIYFTEKLLTDDELPAEYKLYFPLQQKGPKSLKGPVADKQNIIASTQEEIKEIKPTVPDPSKPLDTDPTTLGITEAPKPDLKAPANQATNRSLQNVPVLSKEQVTKKIMSDILIAEAPNQVAELPEQKPTGQEETVANEGKVSGEPDNAEIKVDETETKTGENDTEKDDVKKSKEGKENAEEPIEEALKDKADKITNEEGNTVEGDKKSGEENDKGESDKNANEDIPPTD